METLVKVALVVMIITIPLLSFAVWNGGGNNSSSDVIVDRSDTTISTLDEKIVVLVSFYPLFDFTQMIAGDKINAELLVQNGVEPHDWEPSIRDIEKMQKADAIVINGLGWENWIDKFSEINIDTKIVDTSTQILDHDTSLVSENVINDPHVWLNPNLAKIQVQTISDALQKLDPDNASYYESNTAVYLEKLDMLDNSIRNELSSCTTDFITYHNAFSYFAAEYGLDQHTIISSNDPHMEPTPKTFQNIIKLAKDLDIHIIFTEEGIDQRTLDVISQEIDGRTLVLSPIEIGNNNSSYIQRMETNLSNLKEALC